LSIESSRSLQRKVDNKAGHHLGIEGSENGLCLAPIDLLLWEHIAVALYAGKFKVLAKVETYDQQDFLEVYAT